MSNSSHNKTQYQAEFFDSALERAERLDIIAHRVGITVWKLQELENVLASYFVLVELVHDGMSESDADALIAKEKTKTFGTLLKQFKKAKLLDIELEKRFDLLLGERNWLIHKSHDSSRSAIHLNSSMQKLLARLYAIDNEALSLIKVLDVLLDKNFVKKHSLSKRQLEENTQNNLTKWHKS